MNNIYNRLHQFRMDTPRPPKLPKETIEKKLPTPVQPIVEVAYESKVPKPAAVRIKPEVPDIQVKRKNSVVKFASDITHDTNAVKDRLTLARKKSIDRQTVKISVRPPSDEE